MVVAVDRFVIILGTWNKGCNFKVVKVYVHEQRKFVGGRGAFPPYTYMKIC